MVGATRLLPEEAVVFGRSLGPQKPVPSGLGFLGSVNRCSLPGVVIIAGATDLAAVVGLVAGVIAPAKPVKSD